MHQVVVLFKFQQELITTVVSTLVVVFIVGAGMVMVKLVMPRVVNLSKFQQECITAVALTLVVLFNVGGVIRMHNPRHLPISELGTVVNNPANSTIILLSTKLYFSKTPVGIHNDPLPLPPLMRRIIQ